LLEIARSVRGHGAPGWATVAMARPSELEGRLLAILDPSHNRRRATRVATFVGLVAVSLLVVPLAALQPRAVAQEVQQVENIAPPGEGQAGRQVERRLERQLQTQLQGQAGELVERLGERVRVLPQDQHTVDPRVMRAFLTALADAEPEIRAEAANALGMIESAEATLALSQVLEGDVVASVREEAAWALGMIEDDTAVPALSAALSDEDAAVRVQAAWALGMIEGPGAVEALSAALRNDPSADAREEAAWALGMIEDEAALDALLDAMTDEDIDVRKQALWAVGQISG
jgi:HEAT repeat protein